MTIHELKSILRAGRALTKAESYELIASLDKLQAKSDSMRVLRVSYDAACNELDRLRAENAALRGGGR